MYFNSPLFGEVRNATDQEKEDINYLLERTPQTVFGLLNKKLNTLGYIITIDTKREEFDGENSTNI